MVVYSHVLPKMVKTPPLMTTEDERCAPIAARKAYITGAAEEHGIQA